ncbi:MAG: prolipoprotein diacylglyceryl transferase [Pseudomonadota bacterium]
MIAFPAIDPIAIQIGPIAVRWYGLAYVAGIGIGWWYLNRAARQERLSWNQEQIGDLVFYAAVGAVLGGRIGYALFYNLASYASNPLHVFAVWEGGMSFHGGVLGFILALWLYARRAQFLFFALCDFVVRAVPIGLLLGRVANFVNQELWGAPTTLPWGVVFPLAGGEARHPSQLYEAFLEGAVLFLILRAVALRGAAIGTLSAVFLIGYGSFRFLVEFVREPDAHIGYLAWGWLTMGQVLSLPMIFCGLAIAIFASRRPSPEGV